MSSANQLSRRAEAARKELLTYIQDHRLERGDRLPSYAALRRQFGFGSQTIADAVDFLCRAGVLEVQGQQGLFVRNPAGGNLTGRTIAVVIRALAGSAYSATLAGYIQKLLSAANCRCLAFYRREDAPVNSDAALSDFPGLEQAVDERLCDGLITLCPFDEAARERLRLAAVPYCFIGDDDKVHARYSVVIDVNGFLREAEAALLARGCRRPAQLCIDAEQAGYRRGRLPVFIGSSYAGGESIAAELLALPPAERPDGIISDDDTVVSGLLAGLLRRQWPRAEYLPPVVTIIHTELQEQYPVPDMILFQQDIEKYAEMAVTLLLELLRGGVTEKKQLVYRFRPVEK